MISGFQIRECGLGLGSYLTDAIYQKINDERRGKRYKSSVDAMFINVHVGLCNYVHISIFLMFDLESLEGVSMF